MTGRPAAESRAHLHGPIVKGITLLVASSFLTPTCCRWRMSCKTCAALAHSAAERPACSRHRRSARATRELSRVVAARRSRSRWARFASALDRHALRALAAVCCLQVDEAQQAGASAVGCCQDCAWVRQLAVQGMQ